MVHFVSVNRTRRLPVLHVFGKWPIDGQSCLEQFGQLFPDTEVKVIVFCDVVYSHCMGKEMYNHHLKYCVETASPNGCGVPK